MQNACKNATRTSIYPICVFFLLKLLHIFTSKHVREKQVLSATVLKNKKN